MHHPHNFYDAKPLRSIQSPKTNNVRLTHNHIRKTESTLPMHLQGDRKVMQPMLKYLLMVAIQYNSTGSINTQYRCDYTRAHAGHVML
jgi:hypothetical protein